MAAWGYEFYLLVLKDEWEILSVLEDKIRIPARPCIILSLFYENAFIFTNN